MSLYPRQHLLHQRPIPVEFDGWLSDTQTLMQSGWEISVDYEPHTQRSRFAFRNKACNMYGFSDDYDMRGIVHHYMHLRDRHREAYRSARPYGDSHQFCGIDNAIRIRGISSEIQLYRDRTYNFAPMVSPFVNMETVISDRGMEYISKMPWFDTAEGVSETILFEGHEVPDLMKTILEKQEKKQKDIRKKLRKAKEAGEDMPEQRTTAKIITLG